MLKVLLGITTYGAAPYVDLSLSYLTKFNHPVVVFDDGSRSQSLVSVCKKHKVQLFDINVSHLPIAAYADVRNTLKLIRLGKLLGCLFAIKISRRWICMLDPVPSLLSLAQETDGATFTNITTTYNYGFRTLFIAFKIALWIQHIDLFLKFLTDHSGIFAEGEEHNWARSIQPSSALYSKYVALKQLPPDKNGYVVWDWMGNDRAHVPQYILWHDTHPAEAYFEKSQELKLPWTLLNFKDVNGFK